MVWINIEQYYNGYYYDPVCNGSTLQKNVTFNAHFRVYVKFKSRPAKGSDGELWRSKRSTIRWRRRGKHVL